MVRLPLLGLRAALASAIVFATLPNVRASAPDSLLPTDADSVVSVNVRQIVESDIVRKYALEQIEQALKGNDAQKLLTELGIDPLKDISKVVIGASGKDSADMKFLVIVHGKFDPAKITKAAEGQTKSDGAHFSQTKDGKEVIFKYQPDKGNPVFGAVVDDNTVVLASDKKGVSSALASDRSGNKPGITKELSSLIGRMDDKASIWMAMVVKGKLDDVKLPGGGGNPNLKGQLAQMETVTAVLKVATDIALEINFGMKDAAAAEGMGKTVDELLQTVKGAIPFLAAQNPQMKPLTEVSKTLKSSVQEKGVVVTAKLSGTAIGSMIKPPGN